MAVDQSSSREPKALFTTTTTEIRPDGLLLYVAEASYEPGASPLSTWIPIAKYEEDPTPNGMTESTTTDGPLDVFHRLPVIYFLGCPSSHVGNLDWFKSESREAQMVDRRLRWM
jgi:snurportin-1